MVPLHRHAVPVLAAALLAGCSVPLPTPPPPPKTKAEPAAKQPATPSTDVVAAAAPWQTVVNRKTLLMHYMPWYVTPEIRGFWGSHWTGHKKEHDPSVTKTNGLPDIWSHYHPLIGLYDTTDAAVLECQLLQMKLAGIDGVVADWYGIDTRYDYPEIHASSKALFAASSALGMTFAACYEDRSIKLLVETGMMQPAEITNHLVATFRWMQDEWFTKPNYVRLDGRPLLMNFGPMYLKEPGIWQTAMESIPERPAFFALHHLWRQAGADGGFTWVHWEPWDSTDPREIRIRVGEVFTYFSKDPADVIVSAFPGFNDVYTHEQHRELDYRGGAVLRKTLEVGMEGPWPVIQLVTWNDYGEGTMIEPTHEFGYLFLEIIQEIRARELGPSFTPGPADLRLPHELLKLRKAGQAPAAELDEIARLLAQAEVEAARTRLSALAGQR